MLADLKIRPAEPAERASLEELQWRASLANAAYRDALLADRGLVVLRVEQIMSGGTIVAERADRMVGFATLIWSDGGEAELDGLFVEPDQFGLGIGRRLVEAAKALALTKMSTRMKVIAGNEARGFYERCDFTVAGEVETQLDKALLMTAELDKVAFP